MSEQTAPKSPSKSGHQIESAGHVHAFSWVGGRYSCECGVWCYDLPPIPSYPPDLHASDNERGLT